MKVILHERENQTFFGALFDPDNVGGCFAYEFFCGKELEGAHGAAADTAATFEVLLGQFAKHPELPRDPGGLAEFGDLLGADAVDRTRRFKWSGDEVVVNFGKNVKRIDTEAFYNCMAIRELNLSDSVESIGKSAFYGCSTLEKLDLLNLLSINP